MAAVFARPLKIYCKLDDTEVISCAIETTQEVNGHTEYLLRLQRGPFKENCWKVLRRYNDFAQLHKQLNISGIKLPLPSKRIIGNMRPDFIAERRQELQLFINAVLMNPILASSLPAKRFIDPDSYSQSFHDQAVQNATLCLRSDGTWTLGTTLGPIGWRLRKFYFKVLPKPLEKSSGKQLVKSGSQSTQHSKLLAGSSNSGSGSSLDSGMLDPSELVLEWLDYGPDKYIDEKELGGILKSLMSLQHPHIEAIMYASHNENGCLIIRKFHKHGTLKDMLCMSTPKNPFLSKYGNPKGRTALSMKQVATYGRQILNTLIYLHSKGYAYGHLHSGNIVIVKDCVKLLDIENCLLGVPAFYRPFFVQHSKISTMETIDVYCFGHVIFEMTMGYPLQESVTRQINDCPDLLKNLLESILSKEACKSGLPSLQQLTQHAFFVQHADVSADQCATDDAKKCFFKLSLNAKEQLRLAAQKSEIRLREEQKSVKNQKRIVRVQELMSSEEEKRKTKQKVKQEHKQAKLKQQSSLQSNNARKSISLASGSSAPLAPALLDRADSVLELGSCTESALASCSAKSSAAAFNQQQKHAAGSLASVERQSSSPNMASDDGSEPTRSTLLESICKFNRGSLRKVRSND